MSTQTLAEAARLIELTFIDELQIFDVGQPVTTGSKVTRELTAVGNPVKGIIQSVTLEAPNGGLVSQGFAIKVPVGVALAPGQAVRLLNTRTEAALAGMTFLVDTVSLNSLATLRKAISTKVITLNSQGKAVL